MDNVKNDAYYVKRLKQDLAFVVTHMKNVDIEELNANEVLLDSMLFRMIQISENAKKLSDEYKLHRGNVPWNAIYGLRNRIVHDYGNVDLNVVFETLKHDILDFGSDVLRIYRSIKSSEIGKCFFFMGISLVKSCMIFNVSIMNLSCYHDKMTTISMLML